MLNPKLGNPAMMRNEQGAGQDDDHLCPFRRRAAEWGGHVVGRIFDFKHVRMNIEQLGGPLGGQRLVGRKSVEENG